jgi:hypothetical protein
MGAALTSYTLRIVISIAGGCSPSKLCIGRMRAGFDSQPGE